MKEVVLTSPSKFVRVIVRGRSKRFRWQLQIRDRLIAAGRGSDDLIAAMRTASTHGDRHGEEATADLRSFLEGLS